MARGISVEQAKKIREGKGIADTKLHKARLKKGLSQKHLSDLSGVSLRAIQCYEQQTRVIEHAKLQTLCDLCSALDCKIEDILEDKEIIKKFNQAK